MAVWLDVSSSHGGWSLTDTDRMRRLVQGMNHPSTQYPSVVFFIGKKRKVQALKSLFPYNNITRRGAGGIAKLHLSASTVRTSHSVFVIDGDLDGALAAQRLPKPNPAPRTQSLRLHIDEGPSFSHVRDMIYGRLLFPFTHVVCIFADDLGGLARVRDNLVQWSSLMPPPRHPCSERPRVVVVVTDTAGKARQASIPDPQSLLRSVEGFASEPMVLDLRGRRELSPSARFHPLQTLLLHELDLARIARVERRFLFSAVHLDALFRKAATHIAKHPHTRFNFIPAARLGNPVNENLAEHLQSFVAVSKTAEVPASAITDYVASALLMDGYPPGMHGMSPTVISRTM